MPVTVVLAHHEPRAHPQIQHAENVRQFLQQSCPYEWAAGKTQMKFTSFSTSGPHKLYPSSSSFVRSAIEAWGRHSHLVFRPDDIWFQILVQMNFYMTKNAESLRDLFVNHQGKEQIRVCGNSYEHVLSLFEKELDRRVKTPWLAPWVRPGFSTSDTTDDLTAIVLMMGMMSTFFDYFDGIICGIPSITVLGTKEDWQHLLDKIYRLQDFGEEPRQYSMRLRPILTRIVKTFDEPESDDTKVFWDQLVHAKVKHSNMCGEPPLQYIVSGWILGLYYWSNTGSVHDKFANGWGSTRRIPGELVFDGIRYGEEYIENLPIGYGKVTTRPITDSRSEEKEGRWLVAGSIGKAIYDGAPRAYLDQMGAQTGDDLSAEQGSDSEGRKTDVGRFAGLLSCLNCFGGSAAASEAPRVPQMEQQHPANRLFGTSGIAVAPSERSFIAKVAGHSTVQPLSGWALFGPQQEDLGPFLDTEEICGPTVDAIDSCDNIEHYGPGAPEKRQAPRESQPYRLELNV